jgi:hypothetical protein
MSELSSFLVRILLELIVAVIAKEEDNGLPPRVVISLLWPVLLLPLFFDVANVV